MVFDFAQPLVDEFTGSFAVLVAVLGQENPDVEGVDDDEDLQGSVQHRAQVHEDECLYNL